MNQILSFKNTENGRKILVHNTKYLCVFLIIFALVLAGEGAWKLYTNLNKQVVVDKPVITGNINYGKTLFNVKSEAGVKKIAYAWNNGEETVIEKSGETDFDFEVNNPIGVNELSIKAYGSDGGIVTYDTIKIVYDEQEDEGMGDSDDVINPVVDKQAAVDNDKNAPTISLTAEPGKVVITASDDVMMSYVTYSWNGGEEVKITGLSADEKTLSAKIDSLKGDNKLKVKAYDKAGNVKEIEKDVHGTDGPTIDVKKDTEKGQLIIKVSDDFGITKIEYNFNNEEKTIENIEGNTYEFKLDLKDGENFIIINAYEGTVKKEYKGKTIK